MDWAQHLRAAFADASPPLDGDVIEELAQHASATYDAARRDGCSRRRRRAAASPS